LVREAPYSDDASVNEVSLNYLHRFRSCCPDKENEYLTFDLY